MSFRTTGPTGDAGTLSGNRDVVKWCLPLDRQERSEAAVATRTTLPSSRLPSSHAALLPTLGSRVLDRLEEPGSVDPGSSPPQSRPRHGRRAPGSVFHCEDPVKQPRHRHHAHSAPIGRIPLYHAESNSRGGSKRPRRRPVHMFPTSADKSCVWHLGTSRDAGLSCRQSTSRRASRRDER
jgi:hypothetical protein